MPRGKQFPPDIKAVALGRIQAGHSSRAVAKAIGVHPTTICQWYRQETGRSLSKRTTDQPSRVAEYVEWVALYKKGLTGGQIALKYGVHPTTVRRGIRKMRNGATLERIRYE